MITLDVHLVYVKPTQNRLTSILKADSEQEIVEIFRKEVQNGRLLTEDLISG